MVLLMLRRVLVCASGLKSVRLKHFTIHFNNMTLDFNHRYFNYLLRCFKCLTWTTLTVISAFTGHDLKADNWGVHSETEASQLEGELLFPLPTPPSDSD